MDAKYENLKALHAAMENGEVNRSKVTAHIDNDSVHFMTENPKDAEDPITLYDTYPEGLLKETLELLKINAEHV